MTIELLKKSKPETFSDITPGDVFMFNGNGNLFMKGMCSREHKYVAIALVTGEVNYIDCWDKTVYKVKGKFIESI